jgi:hypothetical protein
MPSTRHFPPAWTIEEHNDACFIVKDATGQALGGQVARQGFPFEVNQIRLVIDRSLVSPLFERTNK